MTNRTAGPNGPAGTYHRIDPVDPIHPGDPINTVDPIDTGDPIDTTRLRKAFSRFATGVTVVTVGGAQPHGMTANSFTSVSLRPPLVLVCIDRKAIMHGRIRLGRFAISVLAAGQESVARHFADLRRPLGLAQFRGIAHEPGPITGAPLLGGAVARFECVLWHTGDGGDHSIFIGRVLAVNQVEDEPGPGGLLFERGAFRRAAAPADHQFTQQRSVTQTKENEPCE